jgi:hypothetical protein
VRDNRRKLGFRDLSLGGGALEHTHVMLDGQRLHDRVVDTVQHRQASSNEQTADT